MTDLSLAAEFPAPTREAWTALVEKVLKGRDAERALVSRTADGIRLEPLARKAEDPAPVPRGPAAPWSIAARLDHPDPAVANALALADLEGGADRLVLAFAGAPTARGFGLAPDAAALARVFAGIMPDLVALSIEAPAGGAERIAGLLGAWARDAGHAPGTLTLEAGLDPVGDLMRTGAVDGAGPLAGFGAAAAAIRDLGFGGTIARVDGRPVHEAGGSEAQELAALLATGLAYLRAFEAAGWSLDAARDALSFTAVADADQFATVAKLRALRRLWAEIEDACGLAPRPIRLQADSAWRMTTRRDPWVNLLRGTMAAFSAGIGGADGVAILPFTAALGLPDAFARRLARNTQIVLIEEAHLGRVADPVAGAGTYEALTQALVEEGWTRFQEIEREGGIVASVAAGAFQERVAAMRASRHAAVATRRMPITGTSEFPDIAEAPVAVLPVAAAEPPPAAAGALPSGRDAEPFERLRDRSDAILAATGRRPAIFLANLGPQAAFSARAAFAKNAFEAGGIETVGNDGFPDHAALAHAFAASGCRVACLCSSDEVYAAEAAAAATALAQAGAGALYLAGRPGAIEAELAAAGVTRFVFAGCDLPALADEALRLASPP